MFQNSSGLHHIFEANHQNLGKGIDHGEEHPHLDQLDVRSAWEGLADSQETETFKFSKFLFRFYENYSQCGQDEHDGEVDLDDHVEELLRESVHNLAQEDQHCCGQIHLTR